MSRLAERRAHVHAYQFEALRALSAVTHRSVASYIREGVDMVLQERQGGRECQETAPTTSR